MARVLMASGLLLGAALMVGRPAAAQDGHCECQRQVASARAAGMCSTTDLKTSCTITFASSRGNALVTSELERRGLGAPSLRFAQRPDLDPVTASLAYLGQPLDQLRPRSGEDAEYRAFAGSLYLALAASLVQAEQDPRTSSDPAIGGGRATEALAGIRRTLLDNARAVTNAFSSGERWEGRSSYYSLSVRAFVAEVTGENLTLQVRSPYAPPPSPRG